MKTVVQEANQEKDQTTNVVKIELEKRMKEKLDSALREMKETEEHENAMMDERIKEISSEYQEKLELLEKEYLRNKKKVEDEMK